MLSYLPLVPVRNWPAVSDSEVQLSAVGLRVTAVLEEKEVNDTPPALASQVRILVRLFCERQLPDRVT